MTWVLFSDRFTVKNHSQGYHFLLGYQTLPCGSSPCPSFSHYGQALWIRYIALFYEKGVICCFTLRCLICLSDPWGAIVKYKSGKWVCGTCKATRKSTHLSSASGGPWQSRTRASLEDTVREMVHQIRQWRCLHERMPRSTDGTITLLAHQPSVFSLNFRVATWPWVLGDEDTGDSKQRPRGQWVGFPDLRNAR